MSSVLPSTPRILFEDEHLFAVEKPANLHSVRGEGLSVADWLSTQYPTLESASPKPEDSGLVQRLDFETSGVLLGAKTREVWDLLHKALLNGEIIKSYTALVDGTLDEEKTVKTYLGSRYKHSKKVTVYEHAPLPSVRALEGETKIAPLRYFKNSIGQRFSIITAFASPARRHQVRAHCNNLWFPLTGDSLYGSHENFESITGLPLQFFLHAADLAFDHPVTRERLTILCEPTEMIQHLESRLLSA